MNSQEGHISNVKIENYCGSTPKIATNQKNFLVSSACHKRRHQVKIG